MKAEILFTALCVLGLGAPAHADIFDSVAWAADNNPDGMGTGTLGSVDVTYDTTFGIPPVSTTVSDNWNTSLATGFLGTFSNQLAGVVGSGGGPGFSQNIVFSAPVTNPLLLFNFALPGTSIQFEESVTFLGGNNTQFDSGTQTVTFNGAAGTSDDGFVVRANGTFGPGNNLGFGYFITGTPSGIAFTVATSAVPEPSFGMMSALLLAAVGALAKIRRPAR